MVLREALGRFSRATKPDNSPGGPFELVDDLTHFERRFQPAKPLSLLDSPSDIVGEERAGRFIEILCLFL
jgi:hypothetical protein